MSRNPPRRPSAYFDVDLVRKVDGLFKSAARIPDGRDLLFPKGRNNHFRPGAVHELFGLEGTDLTSWRLQDWTKAGSNRARSFNDKLISVLEDPSRACVSQLPESARKAKLIAIHWRENCAKELTAAIEGLRAHNVTLDKKSARQPFENGSAEDADRTPETARRDHPVELSPPPCPGGVPRPMHIEHIERLASNFFGIVVEGRHKSGMRYIAREFVSAVSHDLRLLWYNLTDESELKDVLARLSAIQRPLKAAPGEPVLGLVEWLQRTSTMLVLDGLNHSNRFSFAPMLQLLSRLPGPCRVVVTSSVKTGGDNTHEVGALSADETTAILDLTGITYNRDEMRSIASEGIVFPFALRRAVTRFGKIERDHLVAGMNDLHTELVERLPEAIREVVEVLQVLNAEFDLAVVEEILRELRVDASPLQVLTELEDVLLIKCASARTWKIEASKSESSAITLSADRMTAVLVRLARHYRGKVAGDDKISKDLELRDCMNLFAACRLLQLARYDKPQRKAIRRAIGKKMESYGAFRQMALLYQWELEEGDHDDEWLPLRYARTLFVTGKYERAINVIDQAFHRVVGAERDGELYLSLVRLLAEILIEVDHAHTAVKLLDAALDQADVANLGGLVCVQTVSVLSGGLAKAGMPRQCIELNDDILDKGFEGLALPFSKQVSNIRIGVANRELGKLTESIAVLEEARRFFADTDARAYAWASENLAMSMHLAGDFNGAREALQHAITTNATYNLFNGEMSLIYSVFRAKPHYSALAPSLESELERTAQFETERNSLRTTLPASKLVQHALLDLGVRAAEAYEFDKTKYELFSLSSPHAISSRFNRNLVRRLRDANVEQVLDGIFEAKRHPNIVRSHIYNRIIIDACTDQPILAKKFIYPYLEIIEGQTDSILFLYARYLERIEDAQNAERLLDRVRNKKSFSYFNIKANCAARSQPLLALELNDDALSWCHTRQQRAQILHNKSLIVYQSNLRHLFEDAKRWCEESIRSASKPRFVWPRNLLLKLHLASCELGEVKNVILAHKERFNVPTKVLAKIVSEIEAPRKQKTAALAAIDDLG